MDYTKHLLKKEQVKLGKFETMSKLFEMLSNQQEIKNVGKKAMSLIADLSGEVALVQFNNNKFNLISSLGNKENIEILLENKSFFKKISENKKPFFKSKEGECYAALPILSKDEFMGVLCIYDEQKIECWEEIYTLLHLMSLVFKYYETVEENKLNNVKDNVTELFNYRHFQDQLELELEKATRYHIPLSMFMLDVKSFHLINDKLGFEAGDQVLRDIGEILEKSSRKVDMPARLSGDTFAILLSNTDLLGAYILLNRILLRLNRHKFKINDTEFKVHIKLSATQFEIHDTNGHLFLEKGREDMKEFTTKEVINIITDLEAQKRK
jgi:diguanylate cyclase (GGDEF)-like protein